ncbi:cation diffusion facilitator family transporter [Bifidobacterium scardovii]|uniref:Cation diffusion facilitator family transporter n=1 Tax=Bifidobacterium scardovii TaxID=158787 RepID=A0A087DCL7_9BIFI|nr:cation diffusion facilitator family transporter [Bifidobacterium scardovii]KFI93267.1 cation diffusion facilitator family transporter [Bifidobacterium scardovii]MDK6349327.1 cation diffusion facilitator family transporter [Bifidobacterium scardovii]MDU8980665.1 cation diffusion facilitator family transporter [Bifidobacterium scardovii]BAQ31920.1 putative cation efflux protein [Bifidobacterium scardovii JCM 12489 = DSM 13734]
MAHDHATANVMEGADGKAHQRRLVMTLTLTSTVFVAEVVGAIITGSLALLVDAGHMLTDMSVLIASTVTAILMQRKPSNSRTWGWARLEVITAAASALVLLVVGVYALVEAGMRLFGHGAGEIQDIGLLLFFGILGLAANVGSIMILAGQRSGNMNMKAAFLEVMNDALGSVAVVLSAVVMMSTGWDGFDAVAGGLIALLMIPRAIMLLRNAVKVLLEETPDGLDLDAVREHMEGVPHVVAVHDLHASTVSTGMPILMAHVVVDRGLTMEQAADVLSQLQDCLREHFPVSVPHTTFQLEPEGYTTPSAEQLHE